jgi:AbrB family looped-hinge helix DNA binding protein
MPYLARVSSKGWIVIPKELRERYGIRPGGKVLLAERQDRLLLVPLPDDPVKSFRGALKGYPLVEGLTEARREETAGEELRAR